MIYEELPKIYTRNEIRELYTLIHKIDELCESQNGCCEACSLWESASKLCPKYDSEEFVRYIKSIYKHQNSDMQQTLSLSEGDTMT